jgi:hypothetical protein
MADMQFEIIGKNWQFLKEAHWMALTPLAFGAGGARK